MISDPDSPSSPATRHASADAWAYNSRLGIVLFIVYFAFYAGFIGLCAFALDTMKRPAVAGVNLATVYGLSLIGGALVLAIVYMMLCRREPETGPEYTEAEVAAKAVEEEGGA